MNMQLIGTITQINELEISSATFRKRKVVIKTDEKYPQEIEITFVQDKTELLRSSKIGDKIAVDINIKGSKKIGSESTKFYTEIQGWTLSQISEPYVKSN